VHAGHNDGEIMTEAFILEMGDQLAVEPDIVRIEAVKIYGPEVREQVTTLNDLGIVAVARMMCRQLEATTAVDEKLSAISIPLWQRRLAGSRVEDEARYRGVGITFIRHELQKVRRYAKSELPAFESFVTQVVQEFKFDGVGAQYEPTVGSSAEPAPTVDQSWLRYRKCGGMAASLFLGRTRKDEIEAKFICNDCEVRIKCLDETLQGRAENQAQIYGGLTQEERGMLMAKARK